MKYNLTKSKVWQIIGVAVLCAVCVLGAVFGIVFGMNHSSGDLNVSRDMSNQESLLVETDQEQGITLLSSVATTAADGSVSKTLTATVEADDIVVDKTLSWSATFKNANSTWASGKSVSDYVTLAPSDDTYSCVVTCSQAFGEQIIVTVRDHSAVSTASASATCDYIKRIQSITLGDLNPWTSSAGSKHAWTGAIICYYSTIGSYSNSINVSVTYGVGTVSGSIDATSVTLPFGSVMKSYLKKYTTGVAVADPFKAALTGDTLGEGSTSGAVNFNVRLQSWIKGGDPSKASYLNDYIISSGTANGTNGGNAGANVTVAFALKYNDSTIQTISATSSNAFWFYSGFLTAINTISSISLDQSSLVW